MLSRITYAVRVVLSILRGDRSPLTEFWHEGQCYVPESFVAYAYKRASVHARNHALYAALKLDVPRETAVELSEYIEARIVYLASQEETR